eukprot:m51a1_g2788 hypothetical protein (2596) ;mRNA; r:28135-39069
MDMDRSAPQSDIYGKNKLRKGGRKLPLRATVAVIAGLIVVLSVLAELVPTTSLWLQTINTLSDTALESLSSEAALYRSTVVGRTLEKVNTQISMPVTEAGILLGIDGALPVHRLRNCTARGLLGSIQPLFHDVGRLFPELAFIGIGWINDLGQHLLVDKYGARNCGVFDNETDPNIYWYSYNAAGTALNSTIVETTKNFPMVSRAWWVPDPDNPTGPCIAVIIQSYSVKYLSSYFSGLKHTANGWSMLLNWNMDMIAATEGYPSANSSTKAAYKATASPNATVREIVAEWAAQSGTSGLSATSFELGDLYVDTALITQPGNLTFWLVLVTPKSDFLGDVVQKQVDTKSSVVRIVIILLVVEFVVMVIAVVLAAFLGDRLVKPLFLVSAQMKKVANMELTGIGNINKLRPAVGVAPMHATIMFLDVANFTASMDKHGATVLIDILERMFDSFSYILESNGAIIDKYIGDAIMAVWGCPERCENSEGLSCKATMELLASLRKMNEEVFVKKYGMPMAIRVGLNSGEVYAGNVGSSSRLNYTVLGNAVNLAARLEPLNKEFNTSCCVADSIRLACQDQYVQRISNFLQSPMADTCSLKADHDIYSSTSQLRQGSRKLPLRSTVAASAGAIVVLSVLTALVPTASLWLDTLNTLSDKALDALTGDAELYRAIVVNRTVDRVTAQLSIPVQESSLLLGIKGALRANMLPGTSNTTELANLFRPNFHDMGVLFPVLALIGIGWLNDLGEHLFVYRNGHLMVGLYDSASSSDMHWHTFDENTGATNSTPVAVVANFSLARSDWWARSHSHAVGGMSWTGPYLSPGPGDEYVLTFARQVPDPFNPAVQDVGVILQSLSMEHLRQFFWGLRHTDHGWSMLLSGDMVLLAASDGYPSVDPATSEPISAWASPNATVREVAAVWKQQSGAGGLRAVSFEMEGGLYVDTATITQPGNLTLWLVLITHKSDFLGGVVQTQIDTKQSVLHTLVVLVVVELVVMAVAVTLAAFLGDRLVKPLFHISAQMKKVINMELTGIEGMIKSRRSNIREVYMLESEALQMGRVLSAFSLYVPTIVVRYLVKNKLRPTVGVAPMHATIMFLDIANFTGSMDKHGATVLIDILERMFDSFSYILESNGAIIDKYIGDAIMAVWGCPEKCDNSEVLACKATIEMIEALKEMNEEIFVKQYGMPMAIRVGLNSGEVYAGNVGSSSRLNYTVLGNAVNLAARLEPLNKEFNTTACEAQGDLYDKNKLRPKGGRLPLRATVALAAACIALCSGLCELIPTSALWLNTLNTLSDTALESLNREAELYRSCVADKMREKVVAQLNYPVQVSDIMFRIGGALPVPLLRNGTARSLEWSFRPLFHDLGGLFPVLAFVGIGWVNSLGQHAIIDKFAGRSCGLFDNETSADLPWYSYNEAGTALNSTVVERTIAWPMIRRSWWVRGVHNQVGGMAWTGPYLSVSPGDGFVLAFTRQVADPDNPTGPFAGIILQSYSVRYLASYFSSLRHTAHGWSMLLNWNMDMIAATEGYPSTDPTTKAAYKATASPNTTVREIVAEWAAQSGTSGLSATSFELGDLYVDTALITQPGNLTFWLVLVTPKSDFLGDVVQKQVDTKSSVQKTVVILLVSEVVLMAIAVVLAALLGDMLVKPLFLVSGQLKKIAHSASYVIVGVPGVSNDSLYVPTIVVRYLVKNKLRPAVGVAPMHATIMFLDVANFTASMDKHGATVLIDILERMFDSFSYIIESNGAIIDKYIGDAIMAVWGCPEKIDNSELLACKATTELLESLRKMNEEIFGMKYGMPMDLRIGLHSGEVYAGNVGSSSRLNYTVLGNAVNLAARLEPLNKEFNTTVCVSDAIRCSCEDRYAFRCLGTTVVKGFAEPVVVHELLGTLGELTAEETEVYEHFRAIDRTLCQGGIPPSMMFEDYIEGNPDDKTAVAIKQVLMQSGPMLPLRTTIAVAAGLVVVLSGIAQVVPTTSLWLGTINTLSGTTLDYMGREVVAFRQSVVGRTVDKVRMQINYPVEASNVLLNIRGTLRVSLLRNGTARGVEGALRPVLHRLGGLFPELTFIGIGWVNELGEHALVDKRESCGLFDNVTDPNVYWYSYNASGTGLNSTVVAVNVDFRMSQRSWWVRSQSSQVGGMAWTGPYWSVSPGDSFVLTFTRQVPLPAGPPQCSAVLLLAYRLRFLEDYFLSLRHTAQGWAMLLNWNLGMIAATSGYPSADPETKAAFWATSSPNATVRAIAAEWSRASGTQGLAAMSFELGGLFVDTALITQPGNLTLWLVLVTPKSDCLGDIVQHFDDTKTFVYKHVVVLAAIEVAVVALAVCLAGSLGQRLVRPVKMVSAQMTKVANMEFTGIEGVESARRSTAMYVPTIVVRYLVKNQLRPAVGVAPTHATILFLDIANFTSSMEKHGATALIDILEHMFDSFSYILESNGAIIDKYIGDAIMAVWGCPERVTESEKRACNATVELLESLRRMNEEIFVKRHSMNMSIRVGFHSGEVYAGNVGSSSRLNYTVLGNAVNLAARLEPLNKEFNTTGFAEPVVVHELLGALGSLSREQSEIRESYLPIDKALSGGGRPSPRMFDDHLSVHPKDAAASAVKQMCDVQR